MTTPSSSIPTAGSRPSPISASWASRPEPAVLVAAVSKEGRRMRFVQYYLECLSQASYLIGGENTSVAAVVVPRRDVQEYLDDAAAAGLRIDYVIETHLHADFLSGHLELAEATGATIIYGAGAEVHFAH